jgi:hypothetical protein
MSDLTPPGGEPEYLDSHAGEPITEPATEPMGRRSRRPFFIAGGAVATLALAGGAAWAVLSFLSAGPDAAEALPASSTIAFASINLDPSGEQKIAALNTLKKFPGLKDKLDFDTADDVRKHIFEEIQKDGTCADVDYDKDIEPWLGDRMAVAAVEAGETNPSPVFVVQVTDEGKAKAGLEKLQGCDTSGSDDTGFAFEDGWAVVAETQAIADNVVAQTKDGVLSDEDAYQNAMDEAGDSGIVTMYAAPTAGEWMGKLVEDQAAASPFGSGFQSKAIDQLKNFKGAAAVVRFHDGALEMEFAGDVSGMTNGVDLSTAGKADVVSTLPANTALAFGLALPAGYLQSLADAMAPAVSPGQTGDELLAQVEQETGLNLPEDFEALTGDSIALAVSGDIDIAKIINSGDPSSLELGVKVKGDAAKANAVLDKLRAQMGPESSLLGSKDADGYFVVGPNDSYLDTLLANGKLGDSDTFKDVVPHAADSSSVFFLDFDTDDNWLVNALKDAGAPAEVTDNVEPLSAFGLSVWLDGAISHGLVKLTTD